MTYKPPIKQGGSLGPQGIAMIKVNPGNRDQIRFILKERVWDRTTKAERIEEYRGEVSRKDCPDRVQNLIREGTWWISVNKDLNKIYSVRPVSGVYEVITDHFSAQEGQNPAPKTYTGGEWSYQYFTVILRITDGPEKGMEIPFTLRYHFDYETVILAGKQRNVVAISKPKSKYTAPLMEYLDAAGIWVNGAMPYKDNVLPMIEKRALAQGKTFKVLLDKGQVKSIVGSGVADTFADVDIEE